MNMEFREKLLDKVIRKLGHEHEATIIFARLVENSTVSDETLKLLSEIEPIEAEEED